MKKEMNQEKWEKPHNLIFEYLLQCKRPVLETIEAVIAKQNDMGPIQMRIEELRGLKTTLLELWNRKKIARAEQMISGKKSGLLIILDDLLMALEMVVDNTLKGLVQFIEVRSVQRACGIAVSPGDGLETQLTNTEPSGRDSGVRAFSRKFWLFWGNRVC